MNWQATKSTTNNNRKLKYFNNTCYSGFFEVPVGFKPVDRIRVYSEIGDSVGFDPSVERYKPSKDPLLKLLETNW